MFGSLWKHLSAKLSRFFLLNMALAVLLATGQPLSAQVDPMQPHGDQHGLLPLTFVPNEGQSAASIAFQAISRFGAAAFSANEVTLTTAKAALHVQFLNANPAAHITGQNQLRGVLNFYTGSDPSRWRSHLPTFSAIVYDKLYEGIGLTYNGHEGSLKGTYTIAPGRDPARIRWRYSGADQVSLDPATGDLHIDLGATRLIERAPIAWQNRSGVDVPIGVRYAAQPDGSFGFDVEAYDPALPLVIDPTLIYGTFAGGSSGDYARGIAVDTQGNAYVVGDTLSTDFLGYTGQMNGSYDVIVLKLNPTAGDLVYGTIIGGSSSDQGLGIAVDAQGEAYVTVDAESTNFPIVNALHPNRPDGNHGVLLKFAANGDLAYSTWLPFGVSNSFSGHNVAVDSQGNVVVTGEHYTPAPLSRDLAVIKLNSAGTQTLLDKTWSGAGDLVGETGSAVTIGPDDAIYLTGYVPGPFPGFAVTPNALQSQCGRKLALGDGRDCDDDAFLVILDSAGTVTYASYLGGNGDDHGTGIAVEADGSIIVTGNTFAADFPTTMGTLLTTCHADPSLGTCYYDTFVTKFAPGGTSIEWSTYLNSDEANAMDFAKDVATDAQGNIYVTGYTAGTHFPIKNALQNSLSLGNCSGVFTRFCFDTYLTAFAPDGGVIYSTYLGGTGDEYTGGLALDPARNVYLTGYSYSAHFPTTSGVIQPQANLGAEFFVAKIGAIGGTTPPPTFAQHVYLPAVIR